MSTPNEVELLIRAKNEASKTLKGLAGELDALVESQKALASSSELAQKSQKELADQARELLKITDDLNKLQGKIDGYKKQQTAVDDLNQRLSTLVERQAKAKAEIEATEKPTKKLQTEYAKLGRDIERTQASISKGGEKLTQLGVALEQVGLSAKDLADSEARIAAQQARVSAAIDTTREAAGRLVDAQREVVEVEAKRLAGSKEVAAEIKRRAADEEAAIKRRIIAQERYNAIAGFDAGGKQGNARASADAFVAQFNRDDQAALTAEIKRRAAVEEDAARKQIERQRALTDEADRRRQKLAESVTVFRALIENEDREAALAEATSRRQAEKTEVLRRQVEIQQRITAQAERQARLQQAVETFSKGSANQFDTPTEKAERLARAQKLRAEADLRVIEINRRADEIERRLNETRKQSAGAIDKATGAQRRQNEALQNGFELQRSALSLYQRVRGQLLALAGAYVGVFGAINLVQKSIEDVNTKAGVQNRLLVVTGNDAAAAAKEYEYLRKESERLGTNFVSLANGYSKFAIAAKGANVSAEETRYIFEAFAETSKVFRLNTDETAGVFRALEQILSKSKVQAEELRGQLGDRLSGAFNVLATAIGKTPAELDKLLESGKVSSDFLLLFAREYKNIVADQLPAATKTLDSNIQRLGNGLFDLRVAFLEGPFREELEKLIARFTAFVKSDDGRTFARNLSSAFAAAGKALLFLADNAKTVGITLGIVFGAKALSGVITFVQAIAAAGGGIAVLSKALGVGGLVTAVRGAGVALAALLSGPLGILIGLAATGIVIAIKFKFDRDAKEQAQKQLDEAITGSLSLVETLSSAKTKEVLDPAIEEAQKARDALALTLADLDRKIAASEKSLASQRARGEGGTMIARDQAAALPALQDNAADLRTQIAALDKSITDAQAKAAKLPGVAEDGVNAALAGSNALKNGLEAQFKALEEAADALKIPDKDADKAAKKAAAAAKALAALQLRLKEQFAEQAAGIGKDIAEAEEKSFERTTALIDAASDEKIRELNVLRDALVKAKLPEFSAQIDALIGKVNEARNRAKQTAANDFNEKDLVAAEREVNRLLERRRALVRSIADANGAGLKVSTETLDQLRAQLATLDPQIDASIEKALALAESIGGEEGAETKQRVIEIRTEVEHLREELLNAAGQNLADRLLAGFRTVAESIGGLLRGVRSFGDVFRSVGAAAKQFFSQLLIDIGLAIARATLLQLALATLRATGAAAGDGSTLGSIISIIGKLHSGGPAGSGTPTLVDPRWFKNATRYHNGGVVGLRADEVPAVLQKDEYVMSKGDPRNPLNGGSSGSPQNIQVANYIDSESVTQAGLAAPSGTKAILNIVRANRSAFKQVLA
ncbi:tape measure domain-containing protein [Panacagrimonas perspica]|uniref:Tape measure domain-containing protein n=1 Tax=Panacagrimonas perspica TaxID=381431 RepID=A0A4R7PF62_9GAMM|nr:tape measure protein [Panacagrimonas perspica]TDU32838.1 tape measure domain-containing protein [Panacagrimonas perspica]THD00954.1 hypothetical protein B1810_22100 [Panacagrimonas perspica]